jgi:hypothetical protein
MLSRADAVLIIINIQGNLAQAMYEKENLFANSVKLIQGFKKNRDSGIAAITGMKPQSKLWKQIPQQAAGYYTLRFAG